MKKHKRETTKRSSRKFRYGAGRAALPPGFRPGLSMVEILIALAIAALLLTATAVAFDAAFKSYRSNYEMSIAGVSSRNALYQICSTIRSAWNDPAVDIIDVSSDGNQCSLVDANGWDVEYRYEPTSLQLQVRVDRNDGHGWSDWFVMIDDVARLAVGEDIFVVIDPEDPTFPSGTVGKIIIRFRIVREGAQQTLTAAAVPRNIIY